MTCLWVPLNLGILSVLATERHGAQEGAFASNVRWRGLPVVRLPACGRLPVLGKPRTGYICH